MSYGTYSDIILKIMESLDYLLNNDIYTFSLKKQKICYSFSYTYQSGNN